MKFVVDEAGFVELCLRGLGGRKQCLSLCVSWSLGAVLAVPVVAAVPVPPASVWVAGTPDAGLAWNELYFKAFPCPTGQGFSIAGLFPGRVCCTEGWIANCQFNNFPTSQLWGTSACHGMGCSPVVVAFSHRLVSLLR